MSLVDIDDIIYEDVKQFLKKADNKLKLKYPSLRNFITKAVIEELKQNGIEPFKSIKGGVGGEIEYNKKSRR